MTAPIDRTSLGLEPGGLVLHIGVHKTGTTAIQAALANSRPILGQWQIRYPGSQQAHRLVASSAMNRRLGWRVGGAPAPDPDLWNRFVTEAHEFKGVTVCSSEFFAEASDEVAQGIVDQVGAERMHVVVTLRNLGRILPSAWQQILKSGYETGYEPWLHQIFAQTVVEPKPQTFWNRHRHDQVVMRWAQLVGSGRMTVIVVDDSQPDEIYRNFESLLNLPEGTLSSNRLESANRSMTLAEAEFLRQFNVALGGGAGWKRYGNQVHDALIKGMIETRIPTKDEARMQTPQWALDRAAELAAAYVEAIRVSGVNVVGDLDILSKRLQGPDAIDTEPSSDIPTAAAITALLSALDASRPQAGQPPQTRLRKLASRLQSDRRSKGLT